MLFSEQQARSGRSRPSCFTVLCCTHSPSTTPPPPASGSQVPPTTVHVPLAVHTAVGGKGQSTVLQVVQVATQGLPQGPLQEGQVKSGLVREGLPVHPGYSTHTQHTYKHVQDSQQQAQMELN